MQETSVYKTLALGILVALILWFSTSTLLTSAAEGDADLEESIDYKCAQNMIDQGSLIVGGYESFLNDYFQTTEPSSNQVEGAVAYYDQSRRALELLFDEGLDIEGNKPSDLANKEVQACTHFRDQYLNYLEQLLQIHVLSSASSKVTFTVVDGLKIMNEDLETFSQSFHGTFPKQFNQFNNSPFCYAQKCL